MTEVPRLFGTDGIRGVAGSYPLDPETVGRIGRALGRVLEENGASQPIRVLIGEDTRESSAWISRSLAAGLRTAGGEVVYAGVMTTPGVAFLTRHHGFAAGVVVSASHNPYQDNGIKVLAPGGMKLPESLERKIEHALEKPDVPLPWDSEPPLAAAPELSRDYVDYLRGIVPAGLDVSRYRLVVDCAHGASARVVPDLLQALGIEARISNVEPDGRNINLCCGSLYPETMAQETKASGAHLGVAFDGDADRAIFATPEGQIADGDHILFATAPFFKKRAQLKGNAVVGTFMTNMGLELAFTQQGIALKRTPVGDKYVLEEMLRSGINLGGEPSGHIIFSDLSLAGDGIITLLQVLRLVAETQEPFHRLVGGLKQYPQVIRNVRVKEKPPLESLPQVAKAIEECRNNLRDRGRVLVRYSGTEPLARVMVEGELREVVEVQAARIASEIESLLGAE